MKRLTLIFAALALLAAGCGDDEKKKDTATTPAAPATTQSEPSTTQAEPPAEASPEDAKAVQDVVKRWLIDGDCDLMTDKFLEEQLLGLGDNRAERCELFEKQHTKPQYGEDQIKITDVTVTGAKASLVVGSEGTNIESKYDLVKTGGQWQIAKAELQ